MKSKDVIKLVFFYVSLLLFFTIFLSFFFDFYKIEGVKSDLFSIIKSGFDQFGHFAKYNGAKMDLQLLASTVFIELLFMLFFLGLIVFNFIKYIKENPDYVSGIYVDNECVSYAGGASIGLLAFILQSYWFMPANNGPLYELGPGSIILLCAAVLCIISEQLLDFLTSSSKKKHPAYIVINVLYVLVSLSFAAIAVFMLPRLFNFDNSIVATENANFEFMNNFILSAFNSSGEGIDKFRMVGTWFMTLLLGGYILITTVHINIEPEKIVSPASILLVGLYFAYLATANLLNSANHTMAIITGALLVVALLSVAFIKYLLNYVAKKGI